MLVITELHPKEGSECDCTVSLDGQPLRFSVKYEETEPGIRLIRCPGLTRNQEFKLRELNEWRGFLRLVCLVIDGQHLELPITVEPDLGN